MHPVLRYFFIIVGSIFLGFTIALVLYDRLVWFKDMDVILFGSRVGETMDLGLGFKAIHYLAIGIIFTLISFIDIKKRDSTEEEYDSMWDEMAKEYEKKGA